MRTYDVLLIVSPEAGDEGVGTVLEELRGLIKEAGVTPSEDAAWGRRRLAFDIGRHREGIYHHFRIEADSKLVNELDRRLKLAENVLRHIAVRIDEDLERQVKMDKKKKPPRVRPVEGDEATAPAAAQVAPATPAAPTAPAAAAPSAADSPSES